MQRRRYTPQLTEENVRRLYHLKQKCRRSMASLLNEIVGKYCSGMLVEIPPEEQELLVTTLNKSRQGREREAV